MQAAAVGNPGSSSAELPLPLTATAVLPLLLPLPPLLPLPDAKPPCSARICFAATPSSTPMSMSRTVYGTTAEIFLKKWRRKMPMSRKMLR